MRQIKMKVWDIAKKVFIPEDVYAIVNRGIDNYFGVMLSGWEDYREGEYFYDTNQQLILSTGLLDKNGKEIYEGDIIKYKDYSKGGVLNLSCKEPSQPTRTVFVEIENILTGFKPKGLVDFKDCEIIGNIYQHPNLLTQ